MKFQPFEAPCFQNDCVGIWLCHIPKVLSPKIPVGNLWAPGDAEPEGDALRKDGADSEKNQNPDEQNLSPGDKADYVFLFQKFSLVWG